VNPVTFVSLVATMACLIIVWLMFTSPKTAGVWLLGALLIAPYIAASGLRVRIELILEAVFAAVLSIRGLRRGFYLPGLFWLLVLSWSWTFLATLLTLIEANSSPVMWSMAYGSLRPVLIAVAYYNLRYTQQDALRLLRLFTYLAIPLGLFAVIQIMGSDLATLITVNGYTSISRTPVNAMIESTGAISRAVSVFESPAYAAVYFLLAVGTGLTLLLREGHSGAWTRLCLLASVVCAVVGGFLTLSATFLLGIIALAVFLIFRSGIRTMLRLAGLFIGLFMILVPMIIMFVGSDTTVASSLEYQKSRIASLAVLRTRYADGIGILSRTIETLSERPLQGWGWTLQREVFLGDSYYVGVLYSGGWIGLVLSVLPLACIVCSRTKVGLLGECMLVWLVLLLMCGVGSPTFSIPRLQDWWWGMSSILVWQHKHPESS